MPQLNNDNGSVLVAAIVFAGVLGIAGSGLLMLSGHSATVEHDAYLSECAFQAAESGLQVGKRWLSEPANWNGLNGEPSISPIVNGITVSVLKTDAEYGQKVISARAAVPELTFACNDSFLLDTSRTPAAVFINNTIAGGLSTIIFDGPFHSNAPVAITLPGGVTFRNGPVSTTNFGDAGEGFGRAPSGNNYDSGIHLQNGGSNPAVTLDGCFNSIFTHSRDSLYFPGLNRAADTILADYSSPRGTLYFYVSGSVGMARYFYNGNSTSRPYVDIRINNKIIRSAHGLNVLGTVRGSVTVITDDEHNIYPVGDLTCEGFVRIPANQSAPEFENYDNSNNYGLAGNPNFLALVSGGDIIFSTGYKQIINPSTGILSSGSPGGILYLNAALIAVRTGHGITWANFTPVTLDITQFYYSIRAIGCRAVDYFFNYTQYAGVQANNQFGFYFDTRISSETVTAPGVPGFRIRSASSTELFLLRSKWNSAFN